MRPKFWKPVALMIVVALILCAAASAQKGKRKAKKAATQAKEVERQVTADQVPAAAMATLKKLAGGAKITEFAEEIEYGNTFYEGSWKSRSGTNTDVLVTKAGALVEIEEKIGTDDVPAAVLKAARKAAGRGAELVYEKKTMILYEIKFSKADARHELLLTPDGRRVEEEIEKGKSEEEDEGNGNGNAKAQEDDDEDDEDDDDEDDDDNDDEDDDDDE